MNTPSPATIKKQLDTKALAEKEAEALKKAKMDRQLDELEQKISTRPSTTSKTAGYLRPSDRKPSGGRSTNKRKPQANSVSAPKKNSVGAKSSGSTSPVTDTTRNTSKTLKDVSSGSASSVKVKDSDGSKPEKKPFVRREHLTDRPLRNHPELEALRAKLPHNKKQGHQRPKKTFKK